MIAAFVLATTLPAMACHPVQSDKIHGRDLSAWIPGFEALSPDEEFGYAPNPGQQRTFRLGEVRRIAIAHHIDVMPDQGVCFTWPTEVPSRDSIVSAMEKSLANSKATVELTQQSLHPAPPGEVVFPINGLSGVSAEPVVWHGYVQYGNNKRFSIWARARIRVSETRVKTIDNLTPGQPIAADQVRTEFYEGPMTRDAAPSEISSVIGMVPRNNIPENTFLTNGLLTTPQDVERGDQVQVIVQTAGARIEAQGIAESGGKRGSVIIVRNAKSGRTFRARISDKGQVLVLPSTSVGLVAEEKGL